MRKLILGLILCGAAWAQSSSTNATRLQGRSISSAAPTNNQVLCWNVAGNHWQPCTVGGGGVVSWGGITGTLTDQTDLASALNGKASTSTTMSVTSPITGGGSLAANRTFGCQAASGSQAGCLSSTDWTTFNGKQSALTNPVTGTGTSGKVTKFTDTSAVGDATADTDYAAVPADCPSVTFSSNVATYPSLANCNTILVSPSSGANVTSVGTNPSNGVKDKFYVVVFTQPSPTAVTNVWPSSFVNPPTVAAEASSITRFVVQFDGTNFQYLAATNTSGHGVSSEVSAPGANPASGIIYPYFSSVTHRFETLNSAGNTFGGVQDIAAASNNFLTSIVNGVPTKARPTCANLSDSSGGCSMSTTAGGDLSGTLPSPTVAKVDGVSFPASPSLHGTPVVTASNTATYRVLPSCVDTGGNHLNYDQSTDTYSCGTSGPAGSAPVFPTNAQTTTYQALAADFSNFKTLVVASGTFTITLVASGSQPTTGQGIWISNYGSGTVTVARSGQNINGAAANLTIAAGSASAPNGMFIVSDGTNYFAQPLVGAASGSGITALTGDVTASGTGSVAATIAANVVTSAKMAVVNTRVTRCMTVGANNGPVLADADLGPQSRQAFIPFAATAVEIEVAGDGGTPNVILGKSHAGSITNLTSSALATASAGGIACSNSGGTTGIDGATTCSATIQNTSFAAGDWITLVSGTAGGTAKEMTACVTMTIN